MLFLSIAFRNTLNISAVLLLCVLILYKASAKISKNNLEFLDLKSLCSIIYSIASFFFLFEFKQ